MLHRHAKPAVAGGYSLGAICGAFISAFSLLLLGGLLSPLPLLLRYLLVLTTVSVMVARTLGLIRLKLPQRHFQIDREVFNAPAPVAAARFAFELGLGWRTYVTASAPYGILALMLLASPLPLPQATLATAALALGYGLGRSRIVAAHAFFREVAVDHPKIWLKTADLISLVTIAAIVLRALTKL